jgi:hypothetical protein
MNASLPDFLHRAKSPLRATLLVAAITLVVGVAWAQTRIDPNGVNVSGSVIGDDVLYSIGGGRAVSMGGAGNMQSIGVGVGWNSNLICGDMSITTTLQNQLNGITNGFQTIMSNVIQNATSAVTRCRPDHPARRPGLYNCSPAACGAHGLRPLKMTCRATPIAWRTWPAASRLGPAARSCAMRSAHRYRLRHRAGRVQQRKQRRVGSAAATRWLSQGSSCTMTRAVQPAQRRSATDTSSIPRTPAATA